MKILTNLRVSKDCQLTLELGLLIGWNKDYLKTKVSNLRKLLLSFFTHIRVTKQGRSSQESTLIADSYLKNFEKRAKNE